MNLNDADRAFLKSLHIAADDDDWPEQPAACRPFGPRPPMGFSVAFTDHTGAFQRALEHARASLEQSIRRVLDGTSPETFASLADWRTHHRWHARQPRGLLSVSGPDGFSGESAATDADSFLAVYDHHVGSVGVLCRGCRDRRMATLSEMMREWPELPVALDENRPIGGPADV